MTLIIKTLIQVMVSKLIKSLKKYNYLQIRNVQFYVPKSIADGDCMNSGKAGMGYSRKIKDSVQLLLIKAIDYLGKATSDELVEASKVALDSTIGEYNIQLFEDVPIDFECNNNAFIAGGVKYNFSTIIIYFYII